MTKSAHNRNIAASPPVGQLGYSFVAKTSSPSVTYIKEYITIYSSYNSMHIAIDKA
jgi:hypothetical protein